MELNLQTLISKASHTFNIITLRLGRWIANSLASSPVWGRKNKNRPLTQSTILFAIREELRERRTSMSSEVFFYAIRPSHLYFNSFTHTKKPESSHICLRQLLQQALLVDLFRRLSPYSQKAHAQKPEAPFTQIQHIKSLPQQIPVDLIWQCGGCCSSRELSWQPSIVLELLQLPRRVRPAKTDNFAFISFMLPPHAPVDFFFPRLFVKHTTLRDAHCIHLCSKRRSPEPHPVMAQQHFTAQCSLCL